MRPALTLHNLTFTWPDGTVVLDGIDLDLGAGRHGLVGANGSGKSTLLRVMTGELLPQRGSRHVRGTVAHLPQDPLRGDEQSVADVLGIGPVRAALRAVESGRTDPGPFDTIGDDWDVEERAVVELHRLGLGDLGLDRPIGTLSGGEVVLLSLGARLLSSPSVLLLDEPTNNLDRFGRGRLQDVVAGFAGTLVVASHDRALLASMGTTLELRAAAGCARSVAASTRTGRSWPVSRMPRCVECATPARSCRSSDVSSLTRRSSSPDAGATGRRCSSRSASRRSSWARASGPPRCPPASFAACTRTP